jgi:DNA repair photolyase
VGCSNGCEYCYLKKGRGKAILGGNTPTLKKCFRDEAHALEVFEKELKANLPELQKHGLFFSFTTDPFLPETADLTVSAICLCLEEYCINVKVLTKRCDWIDNSNFFPFSFTKKTRKHIAFGFTLTGHDELEPNASTNAERIEAMRKLHEAGFKTWASIEPVIDFGSSFKMVRDSRNFCDLYKIGLESGKKYDKDLLEQFVDDIIEYTEYFGCKLYFKDFLLKQAGIRREDLPGNCVNRDYNIFNNK